MLRDIQDKLGVVGMIEEMNHPNNQVAREHPSDLDRALEKIEALLNLSISDEAPVRTRQKAKPGGSKSPKFRLGVPTRRPTATETKASLARAELILRVIETISREVSHLPADSVDKLLRSSDPKLLVSLAKASLADAPIDRAERMALRGAERFQKLLQNAGGTVSTRWVSDFLGTTEDAVRKRAQRGSLIARRMASNELSFPRFQFDEAKGQLLPGLTKLLTETKSWDPDELIRFLLVRHEPASNDDTPLKLLQRGEVDRAIDLAQHHLNQRA